MTHIFDTLGVLFDRYALTVIRVFLSCVVGIGIPRIAMEIQHRGRWKR